MVTTKSKYGRTKDYDYTLIHEQTNKAYKELNNLFHLLDDMYEPNNYPEIIDSIDGWQEKLQKLLKDN